MPYTFMIEFDKVRIDLDGVPDGEIILRPDVGFIDFLGLRNIAFLKLPGPADRIYRTKGRTIRGLTPIPEDEMFGDPAILTFLRQQPPSILYRARNKPFYHGRDWVLVTRGPNLGSRTVLLS